MIWEILSLSWQLAPETKPKMWLDSLVPKRLSMWLMDPIKHLSRSQMQRCCCPGNIQSCPVWTAWEAIEWFLEFCFFFNQQPHCQPFWNKWNRDEIKGRKNWFQGKSYGCGVCWDATVTMGWEPRPREHGDHPAGPGGQNMDLKPIIPRPQIRWNLPWHVLGFLGTHDPFLPSDLSLLLREWLSHTCPTVAFWKHIASRVHS